MPEDNAHLPTPQLLRGKRIAIVGGGPAGLTLARLLQMNDVRVHVFERDVEAHARLQGGSLDLHEKSGQLALDRCGLTGHFSTVARPEGQATCVIDKHGVRRAASAVDDEEESRPEIDRGALRDLLLSSLDEGTVIWRSPPCAILPEANRHRLVFERRQAELFDLVIGADGLRSKVRPLITPIKSFYSGVTFIETRLSNVDDRHPEIARYVGPGNVLALGDNKGLLAQRNGDGSIRVYIARRIPEHWIRDNKIGVEGAAQTRERLWRGSRIGHQHSSRWFDNPRTTSCHGRSMRFRPTKIGQPVQASPFSATQPMSCRRFWAKARTWRCLMPLS